MTDGTAASSRTIGSRIRRSTAGANSTMKIAESTAMIIARPTEMPVISSVAHISGQAWSV